MSGEDRNYHIYKTATASAVVALATAGWWILSQKPPTPTSEMIGKTVLLTGGTSGIGEAAAISLARMGANLIIGARDIPAANVKIEKMKKLSGNNSIRAKFLDLSEMSSVNSFAKDIDTCDVLINNAGAMYATRNSSNEANNDNNFERTQLINHLSHFYLSKIMVPVLEKTSIMKKEETRIVNVNSRLEKNAQLPAAEANSGSVLRYRSEVLHDWMQHGQEQHNMMTAYSNSKLCMLSCSHELSRRLQLKSTSNVTVNAVTPGMVNTNLTRFLPVYMQYLTYPLRWAMLRAPHTGADTVVWAATSPEIAGKTGSFYSDRQVISGSGLSRDPQLSKDLFTASEKLCEKRLEWEKYISTRRQESQ